MNENIFYTLIVIIGIGILIIIDRIEKELGGEGKC